MKDNNIFKILSRYLNNQSSPAEAKKVEAWYEYEFARTDLKLDEGKKNSLRGKIKYNIDREISDYKYPLRYMLLTVASIILVLLSFIFYFSINPTIDKSKYVIRKADIGKNVIIQLSDSSVVTLNAGSEIRYPEHFSKKERKIYLVAGEAFFDVKPDKKRPFIVESGDLVTRVLGTKFNVNYYSFLDKIVVTVTRGKVKVNKKDSLETPLNKELFLLPNQQAVFNKESKQIVRNDIDADKVSGWMNGQLYFDNEKLSNVIEILKMRFNKNIEFDNPSLKKYRVSLGFNNNDSFDDILFAIKKSNNLSSSEKSGKIVLTSTQHISNSY